MFACVCDVYATNVVNVLLVCAASLASDATLAALSMLLPHLSKLLPYPEISAGYFSLLEDVLTGNPVPPTPHLTSTTPHLISPHITLLHITTSISIQ